MTNRSKPGQTRPLPIKQRIRAAYRPGIAYYELMQAVFPEDQFPSAWRYGSNGGPPGCAMAFGRAIREMGGNVSLDRQAVWLPITEGSEHE